jgi:hypothetical protein
MEPSNGLHASPVPVQAYSRAAVDEFVASAAAERARLESAIAEQEERTRRARAALGTHRVMVAMLLDAQRELEEIRTHAEAEAAAIVLRHGERTMTPAPAVAQTLAASGPAGEMIDLTRTAGDTGPPPAPVVPVAHPEPEAGGTEYFEFLRGALVDDAPLGPRPD